MHNSKSHIFDDLYSQAEIDRATTRHWVGAHAAALAGVAGGIGIGALLWALPTLAG